jgi:hypothetical protein
VFRRDSNPSSRWKRRETDLKFKNKCYEKENYSTLGKEKGRLTGKDFVSCRRQDVTFGGLHDLGIMPDEDLALFSKLDLENFKLAYLLLPASPPGTSGLGRWLDPDQYYLPATGIIRIRQEN